MYYSLSSYMVDSQNIHRPSARIRLKLIADQTIVKFYSISKFFYQHLPYQNCKLDTCLKSVLMYINVQLSFS